MFPALLAPAKCKPYQKSDANMYTMLGVWSRLSHRPFLYPLCALEAKGAERHWLIVDLQTAYAHIACMKENMGLS